MDKQRIFQFFDAKKRKIAAEFDIPQDADFARRLRRFCEKLKTGFFDKTGSQWFNRCRGNFLPSTDLPHTHKDHVDHDKDKICLLAQRISPGNFDASKN
jgi:hypothetical protein